MGDIAGLPYDTAEFDKDARLLHRPAVPAGTTDLIVVSHGWNNDREAAESLYRKLFGNFAEVTRGDAAIGARKLAIVGVIWPSKKFDELMTLTAADARAAGGAASAGGGAVASPAEQVAAMQAAIDRMAPLFDDAVHAEPLQALRELAPQLEGSTAARAKFVETLRRAARPRRLGGEAADARGPRRRVLPRPARHRVRQRVAHAGREDGGSGRHRRRRRRRLRRRRPPAAVMRRGSAVRCRASAGRSTTCST